MNCQRCQTANPDTAKFCMNCGSPLTNVCPNCKTELPAQAKFCFNCGQQLSQKPVQASEVRLGKLVPTEFKAKLDMALANRDLSPERRVLTILFCDVKGSTSMAEGLDPEEWAHIMNRAFEHMIAPVYQYEGIIARLMGDAILAFFGAPIAHEDDPQRAVLAGLGIVEGIRDYRAEVKRTRGL